MDGDAAGADTSPTLGKSVSKRMGAFDHVFIRIVSIWWNVACAAMA